MAKGRPSKYDTEVKPRFNEIRSWLEQGATEEEVAFNLGISKQSFFEYKKNYSDFSDLVKESKCKVIQQIKAALFKKATGFHYTETVTVMNERGTQTTTYNKYAQPDSTAAMILLKHWDKNEDGDAKWFNDPATYKLKCKEYELKKEHAESENW